MSSRTKSQIAIDYANQESRAGRAEIQQEEAWRRINQEKREEERRREKERIRRLMEKQKEEIQRA